MPGGRLSLVVAPSRWRWLRWRWLALCATVACGLVGFLAGVGVTERVDLPSASWPSKLYYTFGLFLFGGMDLGTPVGGPTWARTLLWIAYFVAPAITASAVIEAVLHLVGAENLLLRRLKGHVIVAGAGRLAHLYLRRLREVEPDLPVIVVVGSDDVPHFDDLRDVHRAQILMADITSEATLRRLRLSHCTRVMLLTDDDFTNLDAAHRILALEPDLGRHVIVHVADLRFMRSMATTRLAQRCHVFNGHQIAASHLVHAHMLQHFERTEQCDEVVLAGFGRFGQTVLDELQRGAAGAFDRVTIVDLDATQAAAVFDEQIGFDDGYRCQLVGGDLRDPAVWRRVEAQIDLEGEPVFMIGSGMDRVNLRIALRLASTYPQAFVIARSERAWGFAEEMSREAGVRTFSVAELVAESMPDAWFGAERSEAAAREGPSPERAGRSMMAGRLEDILGSPGGLRTVRDPVAAEPGAE